MESDTDSDSGNEFTRDTGPYSIEPMISDYESLSAGDESTNSYMQYAINLHRAKCKIPIVNVFRKLYFHQQDKANTRTLGY